MKSTTKKKHAAKAEIYYEIYKAYCRKYTACSVSMDRFTILTTLDFTVSILKLWNRTSLFSNNRRKQALLVSKISHNKGLGGGAREFGLDGVESLQDGEGESKVPLVDSFPFHTF